MRVLIVEDETAAAENLACLLHRIAPDAEIAGYTESVEQTVAWLRDNTADLIFMDIHLSDGDAFAIFDKTEIRTPIVFTTAYDQYALDAFKVNSIDYLLKPVKAAEMTRALDKYRSRTPGEMLRYIGGLNALATRSSYHRTILVQNRDKIIPVPVAAIACIYSTDRHTCIIMDDGTHHAVGRSLDQLMASLDPDRFIRANKQYIISRAAVRDLTVWFDSRLKVTLTADTPEPIYISKNRVAEFKAWLAG